MKRLHSFPLLALSCLVSLPLAAANLVIVVTDPPGQGLNDPTPAAPVGGNTGTTLGAQRLIVFQEAARIWGGLIPSNVTIQVAVSFPTSLTCTTNSAVLGRAGASQIFAAFPNAPSRRRHVLRAVPGRQVQGLRARHGPRHHGELQRQAGEHGLLRRHLLLPRPRQQPRREHQPPHRRPSRDRARARIRVLREPGRHLSLREESPASSTGSSTTRPRPRPGIS